MKVNNKMQGKVKFYNEEKGYGFIERGNGEEDVFFHKSALTTAGIENIQKETALSFDLETDKKNGKQKAVNLGLL